jgi:UDP-N-acetylmuramate dehydrogenase
MSWWKNLRGRVRVEEPLQPYTTFKIGGPAKYFIEPADADDLKTLLNAAGVRALPVLVIGAGSNLLVSDQGIDGLVIKLNSPYFKKLCFDNSYITAGAGCPLNQVIAHSQKRSLSSLEFLAGIPGTVGGALVMNAGITGKSIGDLVEDITVMDYNGATKVLKKEEIEFGYRYSSITGCVVLSARFKCIRKKKEEIEQTITHYLNDRKKKQDVSFPSAGCVFKNPQVCGSAGKLIDLCGLKGRRIGDACVSPTHANFIVNMGSARAEDVSTLMKLIRQAVEDKFKVTLEPEIKLWK